MAIPNRPTTPPDSLLFKKQIAKFLYDNIISVERSGNLSVDYYQMTFNKQKYTEQECREFSEIYADFYIWHIANETTESEEISEEKNEEIIKKSLDDAWEVFNEGR